MSSKNPNSTRAEGFARWLIERRLLVLFASLVVAILLAGGASRLGFIDEYRVFFGEENPQLMAFDAVEAVYTKNDNIMLVVEPPDADAFSTKTLAVVEELTNEAWQIPFAIRVDSLTNFQHTWATEDDLIVEDLVTNATDLSDEERAAKRAVAMAEPMILNRMVPADGEVAGLNVTLQLPREKQDETAKAVAHARALAARIERENPGYRVRITGMAMLNNAFQESAMNDMATLTPLMYLVIIITMALLLRSIAATFATLVVIALSVAGALGIAGYLGMSLTPPSTASITIIMTLAVADSIHLMVTMLSEMRKGKTRNEGLIESLRINAQPVFLTSLTSVIGFLSMNFSEVPPLRDLGNISALGIVLAWAYSMTLLPVMASYLPIRAKALTGLEKPSRMDGLAEFVVGKRRRLLWVGALTAVLLMGLLPLNSLNDQFVDYFDETTAFRQDSDFAMEHLSGIYQIQYSLGAGESSGISEPAYLAKLDEFAKWYRAKSGVVHVQTISDTLTRLNMNMHGDDPEYFRLPDSRELSAQYLLLYEMSLPYGLDLNNTINVDKSATRFTVTVENISSSELIALVEDGEGWLRGNAPEHMFAYGVGPGVMFSYISSRNVRSLLIGTTLAIILIALTLIFALKSVRFGLLSLLPNLVPGAMAFGLWGLVVGEINLALSIVSGMCLGIVVDDTVHFLSKYLRARREQGLNPEDAVRYAFQTVGTALIVTSIVLAAGFMILAQSTFGFNGGMGKMSALIVVLALVADLLFLPPLLIWFEGRGNNSVESEEKGVSHEQPATA
jgi:predicted RND superfamily exporter protein